MNRYARILNETVVEIVELPAGTEIGDCYHPEIAATFVLAEPDVSEGWTYNDQDQTFSPSAPLPTVDLDALKAQLKAQIDQSAETERLKYITPGAGQAMTYQQKVDEARAFKAASNPKPTDYPVLSSEVGITAETLSEVADIVLAAFAHWQQIGAAIEAIRLGAKRDIDAAEDYITTRSIIDAIVWPSALVQA